jgi:hypothetical protein
VTITVTGAPVLSSPPQMLVTVSSNTALADELQVLRVHADGTTYPVLTPDRPYLVAGVWAGYDRHAPTNQTVQYKAIAGATSGVSGPCASSSAYVWLLHPSDPDLSVVVEPRPGRGDLHLGPIGEPSFDSRAQFFDIVGGDTVALGDGRRQGQAGQFSVVCSTDAALNRVLDLLADDLPILVSTPYSRNDLGWMWVQPTGVTVTNPAGRVNRVRTVTIPFRKVAQPDVDLLSSWTCADLAATGWTCAQAATHYATALDMALDRRS